MIPKLDALAEFMETICQTLVPLNSLVPSASASPMARPVTYSGEAEECSGFLLQYSVFFLMQPQLFTSDQAKIANIIWFLSGCSPSMCMSHMECQQPSNFLSHGICEPFQGALRPDNYYFLYRTNFSALLR